MQDQDLNPSRVLAGGDAVAAGDTDGNALGGDAQTGLVDALTNMMHWARAEGADFRAAVDSADRHYFAETGGDEDDEADADLSDTDAWEAAGEPSFWVRTVAGELVLWDEHQDRAILRGPAEELAAVAATLNGERPTGVVAPVVITVRDPDYSNESTCFAGVGEPWVITVDLGADDEGDRDSLHEAWGETLAELQGHPARAVLLGILAENWQEPESDDPESVALLLEDARATLESLRATDPAGLADEHSRKMFARTLAGAEENVAHLEALHEEAVSEAAYETTTNSAEEA